MAGRVTRWAPWITVAGVVALLLGLSWDAVLHKLDPQLAEREGIFTLTNPGHVLFGGGIALIVVGVSLYLVERALAMPGRARLGFAGGAAALLALSGVSFGFATWSGSGLTGGHSHDTQEVQHIHEDGTVHTHEEHEEHLAAQGQQPGTMTSAHDHTTNATNTTNDPVKAGIVHDHGETVAVSTEELAAANTLVTEVVAGTSRFADFNVAMAEGYRKITAGNVIAHYHNQAYLTDGKVLDPERPEQLIYVTLPSGEKRLAGVMFLMQQGQQGPRIGGPLTVWHSHDNLCYNAAGVVAALKNASGECPAGTRFAGKTAEMLHVWLVSNPSGVFGEDMSPQTILKAMGVVQ